MQAPVQPQPSDIDRKNKKAGTIGIVGGILLFIAGINGAAFWAMLSAALETILPDNELTGVIMMVLLVITLIASLGGIAVIIGSVMIMKRKVGLGKFIIGLGAGMGLIGLIISIVLPLWQGGLWGLIFALLGLLSFSGIGIVLSVVARMMAKKPDK